MSGVSKFQFSIPILKKKNYVKIYENFLFDLEKIQNKFVCVQLEECSFKNSAVHHYLENDVEISENCHFDLKNFPIKNLKKNIVFSQQEDGSYPNLNTITRQERLYIVLF